MATLNIDVSTLPQSTFELLEPGWYKAIMSASEVKPTKSGNGEYLRCEFQIIEGVKKNFKVWANLNLWNENEAARNIAFGELGSMASACGITGHLQDSQQLHNIPLMIRIKHTKPQEGYEPQNAISGYKKIDDSPVPEKAPWDDKKYDEQPAKKITWDKEEPVKKKAPWDN